MRVSISPTFILSAPFVLLLASALAKDNKSYPLTLTFVETRGFAMPTGGGQAETSCSALPSTEQVNCTSRQTGYVHCPKGFNSIPAFVNLKNGNGGTLATNLSCGQRINVRGTEKGWTKIEIDPPRMFAFVSESFVTRSAENQSLLGQPARGVAVESMVKPALSTDFLEQARASNGPHAAATVPTTPASQGNAQSLHLKQLLTAQEFEGMGLQKLTPSELAQLSNWIDTYTSRVIQVVLTPQTSRFSSGEARAAIESQISGDFTGWNGETIFKLTNGQIWQQAEYDYTYEYAYMPSVTIYKTASCWKMKVEDVEDTICVKRLK